MSAVDMRSGPWLRVAVGAVLTMQLGACSVVPAQAPLPTVYDLGAFTQGARVDPAAAAPAASAAASATSSASTPPAGLRVQVDAPAWLDTNAMLYRLDYVDAARLASYRDSRWAAPPAALVAERMRARLARMPGGMPDGRLGIELEEFCQSFASASNSVATVRLRVSLVRPGATPVRQRAPFERRVPARTPDAAGGAHALAQATDAVIDDVLAWVAAQH